MSAPNTTTKTRAERKTSILPYPPIPIVPHKHFVGAEVDYEIAWHLVGPTINANLNQTPIVDQYKLYCIAFIEGMRMAHYILGEDKGQYDEQRNEKLRSAEGSSAQEPAGSVQNVDTARRVVYCSFPTGSSIRGVEDPQG